MRRLQLGPLKDFDSSFLLSSQLSRPTCAETLATPSYVGSFFFFFLLNKSLLKWHVVSLVVPLLLYFASDITKESFSSVTGDQHFLLFLSKIKNTGMNNCEQDLEVASTEYMLRLM